MSDGDGANREFEHLQRESSNPPVAGSSGQTVAGGHVGQPAEGSSQTLSLPGRFEGSSNIWPYVFEINQLIRLYRSGEHSKFELTSAITNFLNEDRDLSPKERNESFELYLAEVDSLTSPGPPGHAGKGKAQGRSGPTPESDYQQLSPWTDHWDSEAEEASESRHVECPHPPPSQMEKGPGRDGSFICQTCHGPNEEGNTYFKT